MLHRRIVFALLLWISADLAWAGQGGAAGAANVFPARAEFGQTVALVGVVVNFNPGPIQYRWTQLDLESTPEVGISSANTVLASFTAPEQAVTLRFEFRATAAFQAVTETVTVEIAESDPMTGLSRGVTVCPEPDNQPAVASVPAGLAVEGGSEASIAAADGDDPDNTGGLADVAYQWSVLEGAGVLSDGDLGGSDTSTVAFEAPAVESETLFALSLLVSDSAGCGTSYPVVVLATPPPPVLTASITASLGGQDLPSGDRVVSGESIRLLPRAGYSPEAPSPPAFGFSWRQVEGPPVQLEVDESGAGFTVPDLDSESALAFELTAVDGMESARAVISFLASPPELYFAQVAFGPFRNQVLRTTLVLINDRDVPAEDVRLEFFDFNGDPLVLSVDGVVADPQDAPLAIGPGLARSLALEGPAGVTTVGWGRVRSSVRLTGLVLYQLLNGASGGLDSEVSLFSSARAQRFTTFFGRADGLAFAIANPGDGPTEVNVRVFDDGAIPAEVQSTSLMLPAGRQVARFLDAAFFGAEFPMGFQAGTLVVESYDAPTLLTVLKTDAVGLPFSTLPVSTRATAFRPPPPNEPPTARLLYRIGSAGPFIEPDSADPIPVTAPVEITLDAGLSSDPEGAALTFTFNLETNLTSGGANLQNVNQSLRILNIAEGTQGTVRVAVTVTDPGGMSDDAAIVFEAP